MRHSAAPMPGNGWSRPAPAPLLEKLAGGAKLKEHATPQKLNSAIAVIDEGLCPAIAR